MEHSDVFLSYRRKDVDFAKRLDQALKDSGREVWVDWEDIPPGVEGFSDEIQRGIESANALIAVLSPNYIESEYCLMELREALKLKKRVIPIVLQKFEPAPPPDGIGHINWVYFTPHAGQENNFDEAFKKVIAALQADYDHSREHTRLLLRAIEWDKKARNPSYVLKGTEIEKAEGWHVAAASKEPSPTALQGEYILISRKIQRRQQQRLMGILGILVIVAIAAILAVIQSNESRRQEAIALDAQARAELSAEIAQSSALAAAALQPGNEELALALVLEASRSKNTPRQVFQTLEDLVYRPGSLRYVRRPAAGEDYPYSRYPAVDPEGRFVISKNRRYDLTGQTETLIFTDVPDYILTGVYLPDGKRVILAGDDEGFRDLNANPDTVFMGLYDAETGALIRPYDTQTGVFDIQLSGDGKTIISFLASNKAVLWDIETGEKQGEFDIEFYIFATFSPDLTLMAVLQPAGDGMSIELIIKDTATLSEQYRVAVPMSFAIQFSPDGSQIAVASQLINIYSVTDRYLMRSLSRHERPVVSLRYSPDGSKIVSTGSGGEVIVWDNFSGRILAEVSAHTTTVSFADFVHGGDRVVSVDVSGVILEWDVMPGNLVQSTPMRTFGWTLFSRDGQTLYTVDGCKIAVWDTMMQKEIDRFTVDTQDYCDFRLFLDPPTGDLRVLYTRINPDGATSADIKVIDPVANTTLGSWSVPRLSVIYGFMPLPDGQRAIIDYILISQDPEDYEHIELWDFTTGQRLHAYEISNSPTLALSPDGTRLLSGASYYTGYDENGYPVGDMIYELTMWDVETGTMLYDLKEQSVGLWFMSDGAQFMMINAVETSVAQYEFVIRDTETGEIIKTLPQRLSQPPFKVIFSSDHQSFFVIPINFSGGDPGLTPSGIGVDIGLSTIQSTFSQWSLETGGIIRTFSGTPMDLMPLSDGLSFASVASHADHPDYPIWFELWQLATPEMLIDFVCANRSVPEFTPEQRTIFRITEEESICASRNAAP